MIKIEFSFTTIEEAAAFVNSRTALAAPTEPPTPKSAKAAKAAPAPTPVAPAASAPTAGSTPAPTAAPTEPAPGAVAEAPVGKTKAVEYADTELPKRIASAVVRGSSPQVRELLVAFGAVDPATNKPSGKFLKPEQLDEFSAKLAVLEEGAE